MNEERAQDCEKSKKGDLQISAAVHEREMHGNKILNGCSLGSCMYLAA